MLIHLFIAGVTLLFGLNACNTMSVNHSEGTLKRLEQSPNYRDGKFHNLLESPTLVTSIFEVSKDAMFNRSKNDIPEYVPKINSLTKKDLTDLPNDNNFVVWLGHSSVLLKIQGKYILTDPVFSQKPSPVSFVGSDRFHPVPIKTEDLPELDIVLISHDHYDHLDRATIEKIKDKVGKFITPLAVGDYLKAWGVDANKVVELDWWENANIDGFTISATPARHSSGRGLANRYSTLWAGFAVKHDSFSFYYTGDTGMMPTFEEIGKRFGPFDLTLTQLGAYGENWPLIHMTPEEAVKSHKMVQGIKMLPIHWGTFNMAFHAWDEPYLRAQKAAKEENVDMIETIPGSIITLETAKEIANNEIKED